MLKKLIDFILGLAGFILFSLALTLMGIILSFIWNYIKDIFFIRLIIIEIIKVGQAIEWILYMIVTIWLALVPICFIVIIWVFIYDFIKNKKK